MPSIRAKRAPPKPPATAYTSSTILQSTSVLTKPHIDLHAFLLTCLISWSEYTEAQKHQIISSLPQTYRIYNIDTGGNLECPLSIALIRDDPYLRDGAEKFKRDVSEGYYDPTWRKNAAVAMRDRAEGKFDEFVRGKVEAEYGEVVLEGYGYEEGGENERRGSDNKWNKDKNKAKSKGKIDKRGKGRRSPKATAARGELQSAMEMEN